MTLKINNWKKLATNIAYAVLGGLLLIFFLRVAIWENDYYKGKEGSERSVAIETQVVAEVLEETPPTADQLSAYRVPDDHPRYITIESIGILGSRVIALGLKGNTKELDAPNNIHDAGWYNGSAKPVSATKPGEQGTVLIDGHSGGPNEKGIFANLASVKVGAKIEIERGDGTIITYVVVDNKAYPKESEDLMRDAMTSPERGVPSLSIITCIGDWNLNNQSYDSRQLLRAIVEK